MKLSALPILAVLFPACMICAEPAPANHDESKVAAYTLPDPLRRNDGSMITNAAGWPKRRAEILELFRAHVYGHSPGPPTQMEFNLTSHATNALNGLATRKEYNVRLSTASNAPSLNVLLYVPNGLTGRAPAILGLNFSGNYAIHTDPGIWLPDRLARESKERGATNNQSADTRRGREAKQWAVEKILKRGYAVATAYCGDIEPDSPEGWKLGIRAALSPTGTNTTFKPDDWAAISAWAWGLSRALDCLERDPDVDGKRVAVFGHSRLGKAAVWAGAQDERFAMVLSNESGEGGAALARRFYGETTAIIQQKFPHWFCGNFRRYADNESTLPVDQHELLALVAPRPLYVASAAEDRWSDPRGEFLSAKGAEQVYALFGKSGLGVSEIPGTNQPAGDFIRYHIRSGRHDVTEFDWNQYLDFADRHLRR